MVWGYAIPFLSSDGDVWSASVFSLYSLYEALLASQNLAVTSTPETLLAQTHAQSSNAAENVLASAYAQSAAPISYEAVLGSRLGNVMKALELSKEHCFFIT